MNAADQKLVEVLGGGAIINADGSITAPTYNLTTLDGKAKQDYHNVGDALAAIDGNITNVMMGKVGLLVLSADGSTIGFNPELTSNTTKIALGKGTMAEGFSSVAMGTEARAAGYTSVSIGHKSKATENDSTAIGSYSEASAAEASVFGHQAKATAERTTALGVEAEATGAKALASGFKAKASGNNTTALGAESEALEKNATALGFQAKALEEDTIALGTESEALGKKAIATGFKAKASAENSIAFGSESEASGENAVASGSNAKADGERASAFGYAANANGKNSLALGSQSSAKGENTTAIGTNSTAGNGGIAVGVNSSAMGQNSVAMGQGANAGSHHSITIGAQATVTVAATRGIAIGDASSVKGLESIAIGARAVVEEGQGRAIALGANARVGAKAVDGLALGADADVLAGVKNSVAIGAHSVANIDNTVSFGSAGKERRLVNVTAGKVNSTSTDAINGSQLHAIQDKGAKLLDKDAGYKIDGSWVAPNYTDALTGIQAGAQITTVKEGFKHLDGRVNDVSTGKSGLLQLQDGKLVFNHEIEGVEGASFDISSKDADGHSVGRKLTGVANGDVNKGSLDAINGSQLYDAQDKGAKLLDQSAGYDKYGKWIAPDYTEALTGSTDGKKISTVKEGFAYVGDQLTGITSGEAGIVKLSDDKQTIVIDNGVAKGAKAFDISNMNGDVIVARKLTGVANGIIDDSSYDAINGSQLAAIIGKGAYLNDKGELIDIPKFDFGQGAGNLSLHGALTHLHGRIDGIVKPNDNSSTDETSNPGTGGTTPGGSTGGSGLPSTGIFVSDGSAIMVSKEGAGANATKVDFTNAKGEQMKLTGLANGEVNSTSTDAVTGQQLHEVKQDVAYNTTQINSLKDTMSHYNTRLGNVEKIVHQNRKVASAGVASAMAMSSIPYVEYAKYSMGMGVGHYDGETAMSIGFTWKGSDRSRFRLQGSYDSQNKVGLGAGVAFEL